MHYHPPSWSETRFFFHKVRHITYQLSPPELVHHVTESAVLYGKYAGILLQIAKKLFFY